MLNRVIATLLLNFVIGACIVAIVGVKPRVGKPLPVQSVKGANAKHSKASVVPKMSSTERTVRRYFTDIPVLIKIAQCESSFRHTLKSGKVLRGRKDPDDIGVMQINVRYHGKTLAKHGLNPHRLEDNLTYARLLYEKQGTSPWNPSRECWTEA